MNKRILEVKRQIAEKKLVCKQHKSLSREHKSLVSQQTQHHAKIERELLEREMASIRIEKEWASQNYPEDTLKSGNKMSQILLDQSKEPHSSFSLVKIKN